MKKVLLFFALLFVIQTADAQINDIYLREGVVLSDNQWHFDDYSVIQANNNVYLVITPNSHYYAQLLPFDKIAFERYYQINVLGYRPYVYNNYLGWYIQSNYLNYFYNPVTGDCWSMSYVPVFYNFYYSVQRLRYLDLRYWHWRSTGRYHHLWHPPHHRHYHHHGPIMRPHNPPHHGNGPGVRPHNPPHRGNGQSVRPQNPPHRGNGQSVRPQNSPHRGNGQSVRPQNPPRQGNYRHSSGGGQGRGNSGSSSRHR